MIRKLMTSSALIALMSAGAISVAAGQTDSAKPAVSQDAAAAPDTTAAPAEEVVDSSAPIAPKKPTLASAIIGRSVYSSADPESDNIGDVNDLIVDETGAVTHAVVGVGGFLGIGEKGVAVPFDQLEVAENNGDLRLVYAASKDQLEAAPAFDRTAYDPAERSKDTTGSVETTGVAAADAGATDTSSARPTTQSMPEAQTDVVAAPSNNQVAANNAASPDGTVGAAPTAEEFVQKATAANQFEIDSSTLAEEKAQGEDVKGFAQKMIDDHTKAGEELEAAVQAANAGAAMPDQLDQPHKEKLATLDAASGPDFDRQYVDMQVQAHDEAVQLFQSFAERGDQSPVREFAAKTLPTLKDHQKMIHDISGTLQSAAANQ